MCVFHRTHTFFFLNKSRYLLKRNSSKSTSFSISRSGSAPLVEKPTSMSCSCLDEKHVTTPVLLHIWPSQVTGERAFFLDFFLLFFPLFSRKVALDWLSSMTSSARNSGVQEGPGVAGISRKQQVDGPSVLRRHVFYSRIPWWPHVT